jgi:hypothetical protein
MEEGGANVRDDTHDEKNPSSNPYYIVFKDPSPSSNCKEGHQWVNEGSKWSCEVGEYYNEIAKW